MVVGLVETGSSHAAEEEESSHAAEEAHVAEASLAKAVVSGLDSVKTGCPYWARVLAHKIGYNLAETLAGRVVSSQLEGVVSKVAGAVVRRKN